MTGSLSVKSREDMADLYVDGLFVQKLAGGFRTVLTLREGRHTVRAELGKRCFETTVEVSEQQETRVDVVLPSAGAPAGESEEAKAAERKANVKYLMMEGRQAFDRGNYDLALRAYQEASRISPYLPGLADAIGQVQAKLAEQQSREAEKKQQEVEEAEKRALVQELMMEGRQAEDRGDYDGALRAWQKAFGLSPENTGLFEKIRQAQARLTPQRVESEQRWKDYQKRRQEAEQKKRQGEAEQKKRQGEAEQKKRVIRRILVATTVGALLIVIAATLAWLYRPNGVKPPSPPPYQGPLPKVTAEAQCTSPDHPRAISGAHGSGTVRISSGTGTFAELSGENKTVNVESSGALRGTIALRVFNTGPGFAVAPLIETPSWGRHQDSWKLISNLRPGESTWNAQVNERAPDQSGTYYIVFAFNLETNGASVASATNWAAGPPVWNDGNDLAQLDPSQILQAQQFGCVVDRWRTGDGSKLIYVPADAVAISVGASSAGGAINSPPLAGRWGPY